MSTYVSILNRSPQISDIILFPLFRVILYVHAFHKDLINHWPKLVFLTGKMICVMQTDLSQFSHKQLLDCS